MAEIYVPINYSNVKDIIPVGEDITYSTLCKAIQDEAGSLKFWKTHLLMTEKGIAFTKPGKKKKDPPKLIYVDWTRVTFVFKDGFYIDMSKNYPMSKYDFERVQIRIKSDRTYETKDKFKKRLEEFPRRFFPYVLEKKKFFLQSQDSSFLTEKQRDLQEGTISGMEKFYRRRPKTFLGN